MNQTFTALELENSKPKPNGWLIPGILPDEGLALLAAKPKIGKSWLALDWALAVASGGRTLDLPARQGDVLYLALEDTQRRLYERLQTIDPHGVVGDRDHLHFATEWSQLDRDGANDLAAWLYQYPKARLVIVDVWQRLAETGTQYGKAYEQMAILKELATLYHVTFLVVHHSRKTKAQDVFDEVTGSNGLAAAADAVLILHRERASAEAELWVTGRDVPEARWPLTFDHGIWRRHPTLPARIKFPTLRFRLPSWTLHLLLTLATAGLWLPFWIASAQEHRRHRRH
jgi:AAA domain